MIKTLFFSLMMPVMASAQDGIAALWQDMPDDIVPVLSRNNRLDMIDFCANDMEARVSNLLGGNSVMDTLTGEYLRVSLSPLTTLEMRLTCDGHIVAVRTAAALTSTVTIYNKEWQEERALSMPEVSDFLQAEASKSLIDAIATVPLITAALSPEDESITFTLHLDELSRDDRKAAAPLLHTVKRPLQDLY